MSSLLDQLSKVTVVVADTGDINAIGKFKPRDATTNPSLIMAAAAMKEYAAVVDESLNWARKNAKADAVLGAAIDRLSVEFGLRILKIVSGRVSTEVDARLSYDTAATVEKGRTLIKHYEAAGVKRERVLIKVASTWEGIRAAEILEKEGIHCNLTLLFGLHQAVACAEAGVTLISPFVGRILDWYKASTGKASYEPQEDPGVVSVTRIYNYYKAHGHKTEVMGASFRNLGEITELAGCDLLTIAPALLDELAKGQGTLPRKLDPAAAQKMTIDRIVVDEAAFRKMHAEDKMASDKLDEGIKGFTKAIVTLEKMLSERLEALSSPERAHAKSTAAGNLFKVYDMDGDGFITREEWGGTDAVFDAIDTDHDGRIAPEELAAGLGASIVAGS
ncbi:MAG: transaldolase [Polyangiaceae bacterium]